MNKTEFTDVERESLRMAACHRESINGSCCCPGCWPDGWSSEELDALRYDCRPGGAAPDGRGKAE